MKLWELDKGKTYLDENGNEVYFENGEWRCDGDEFSHFLTAREMMEINMRPKPEPRKLYAFKVHGNIRFYDKITVSMEYRRDLQRVPEYDITYPTGGEK